MNTFLGIAYWLGFAVFAWAAWLLAVCLLESFGESTDKVDRAALAGLGIMLMVVGIVVICAGVCGRLAIAKMYGV